MPPFSIRRRNTRGCQDGVIWILRLRSLWRLQVWISSFSEPPSKPALLSSRPSDDPSENLWSDEALHEPLKLLNLYVTVGRLDGERRASAI